MNEENRLVKVTKIVLITGTLSFTVQTTCFAQNNSTFKPTMKPIGNDSNAPKFPPQDPNKRISFPQVQVGQPYHPGNTTTTNDKNSATPNGTQQNSTTPNTTQQGTSGQSTGSPYYQRR